MAIGKHYMYTQGDILFSYFGLMVFTVLMFALAWWRFQKAVVT
jgi:ABC-2 type transport system permease protein